MTIHLWNSNTIVQVLESPSVAEKPFCTTNEITYRVIKSKRKLIWDKINKNQSISRMGFFSYLIIIYKHWLIPFITHICGRCFCHILYNVEIFLYLEGRSVYLNKNLWGYILFHIRIHTKYLSRMIDTFVYNQCTIYAICLM